MPSDDARTIELPGGFSFDLQRRELRDAGGERVALRRQSLAVLHCLALQPGRLVGKDELIRHVWPDVVVTDDSLIQCIKDLRRALGDDEHCVVQNEPRVGYRLVATPAAEQPIEPATSASEPAFRQDIRFAASFDGTRIAWASSGEGPPLVRAASWMTHLDWDWRSAVFGGFIRRMSMRHRFVRYDERGSGVSDHGIPIATLDDEVRDLEAVVDAAGLQRFALIGRSQGGAIAMAFAGRHPERVRALVIVGGFARGARRRGERSMSSEHYDAICRLLEEGWGQDNAAFRQIMTTTFFPAATPEQIASFNHLQRVSSTPQDAVTIHRMVAEYDASADLAAVRCPTLVLHSPDDALVPFEEARLVASNIRGARLQTFASANHTPLPGEPAFEPVMQCIEDFLHEATQADGPDASGVASAPRLHAVGAPAAAAPKRPAP